MRHSRLDERVGNVLRKAGVHSILVAVSGGADSVALLCLCHALSQKVQFRIEAVNCNFHLRGDESDRDSEFTAALCDRLGVRLHRLNYDVEEYLRRNPGISTEMACRALRYDDFFKIAREEGLDRIAVAHNADDDIETMMLNMLRGSGSRGLRGMDIDNGLIIRPLLTSTRAEIESYLKAILQDYVIDSSNLASGFRRNFIRREVLPLLEQRWPGARKALSRTVGIMKEEAGLVEELYQHQLAKFSDGNKLKVYADGMNAGIVRRFLEPFGGNSSIAEEIMEARGKDFSRRSWNLDSHHVAILERDILIVTDANQIKEDVHLEWSEISMSPSVMKEIKSNRDHSIAFLPRRPEAYLMREPLPGDRISPLGMKGSRLVSDIISDEKLDRGRKSRIRVLVRKTDGEIIWVTGLKRSRHDLVAESDTEVYKCKTK